MARTWRLATVLWLSTMAWIAGCGRLWFDGPSESARPPGDGPLADASVDGATDPPIDASIDAPIGPQLTIEDNPPMSSECGNLNREVGTLKVKNTGTADLQIDSAVADGGFTVKTMPEVIAPGETGDFEVAAPLAMVGTDVATNVKTGMLTIESNTGTTMVVLKSTVMGASLVMTPTSPIIFLGSSGACPGTEPFEIKNEGNVPVTVIPEVQGAFGFSFTSSSDTDLAPGESLIIEVHVLTDSQCSGSGSAGFIASSGAPICQAAELLDVTFQIPGSGSCQCS